MKAYELMALLAGLPCNAEVFIQINEENTRPVVNHDLGSDYLTLNGGEETDD